MFALRVIAIESPIAHAVRVACTTPNQKGTEMSPAKKKAAKAQATRTRRVMSVQETILLSDWLRTPGNIEGCTQYVQVAEKAAAANLMDPPPSVSSITTTMKALGLELAESPVRPEQELRNLREATAALMEVVRDLLGRR